eukprot:XP_001694155.1 Qb-SNARE protein, Bos1/Membrin family [Chlamydomonas reinhardtii]
MSDLTSLHSQAKRLILLLREGLERLEALEGATRHQPGTDTTSALARDLRSQLQQLARISTEMDSIWRMQVIRENASKRDVWKRKVEQVSEELDTLRVAMDRHGSRESKRAAEARDREDTINTTTTHRQQEMDEEAQVMGSVARSKRYLEEMFESGTNILVNMAGNRERLKSAQKRALDVLNTVGLGESLLRLIERRQRMDMWTAYGGMIVITLVVCLCVWWFWF